MSTEPDRAVAADVRDAPLPHDAPVPRAAPLPHDAAPRSPDDATTRILRQTALRAAPSLLGAVLTRESSEGLVAIRLTEVEAYEGDRDPGSHAYRGKTARNAPMFEGGGYVYAYLSYGVHVCLNLVCGEPGRASACLLRAGEVVAGEPLARARREAVRGPSAKPLASADLARGPGSLVRALGAELADSGRRLDSPPFSLTMPDAPIPDARIARGLRVGVATPGGLEPYRWRFSIADDPTVSRYQPHRTVRPLL